MEAFYDRSILGDIEYYEMFGEHEKGQALKKIFKAQKRKLMRDKVDKIIRHDRPRRNFVLEGILVAAGWDGLGNMTRASLYLQSGEDIILKHQSGLKKFKPYINDSVRISGVEILDSDEERKLMVRRISRIVDKKYSVLSIPYGQQAIQTGG